MLRRAWPLVAVFAFVLASSGCATQTHELSDVRPETRLRVWHNDKACCASPVIGTLVNYDADSLRLRVSTQPQPLALSRVSIDRIESERQAGHAGSGALIGLAVGTVTGAIIGYSTACSHCDGDWRPLGALFGGAVGAVAGTLAGIIVGVGIRRDIWDPVSR